MKKATDHNFVVRPDTGAAHDVDLPLSAVRGTDQPTLADSGQWAALVEAIASGEFAQSSSDQISSDESVKAENSMTDVVDLSTRRVAEVHEAKSQLMVASAASTTSEAGVIQAAARSSSSVQETSVPNAVVGGGRSLAIAHPGLDLVSRAGHAKRLSARSWSNSPLKRLVDVTIVLSIIIVFAPVMLLIAAAILVQDGRSVMFGHSRVGRNGKMFSCLKFRTMVRDADAQLAALLASDPAARVEWEQTQRLKNDPRIIPGIGHFLRKTSLDELPQLFNVLRGEMSMVGPRPVVPYELERYGAHRRDYLSVRPGITGPWQVGERSGGDYASRVRKDVAYVEDATLLDDLRIILRTFLVPFEDRGAY